MAQASVRGRDGSSTMKVILGLACVLVLAACGSTNARMGGDASTGTDSTGAAGMDDPTAGSSAMDTGDAGGVPGSMDTMTGTGTDVPGEGDENTPCAPSGNECDPELACTSLPAPYEGVCGRACTTDADCTEPDEVCSSYLSGGARICINLVPAWNPYEFDQTSFCNETSVPVPVDAPPDVLRGGLCLELCALPGADTSVLTPEDLAVLVPCEGTQECLALLISSTGAVDSVIGACATPVERGESCLANDSACRNLDTDVCFPLDPMDPATDFRCYENCTSTMTCETGTCDLVPDAGGSLCGYAASGGM